MNKYSKNISISIIIFIFLFSLGSNTQAQVRGKALYKKLTNNRNLVKFEGLSRLNWTPDGKYYYIFKSPQRHFITMYKIRTQLFIPYPIILIILNITHS